MGLIFNRDDEAKHYQDKPRLLGACFLTAKMAYEALFFVLAINTYFYPNNITKQLEA